MSTEWYLPIMAVMIFFLWLDNYNFSEYIFNPELEELRKELCMIEDFYYSNFKDCETVGVRYNATSTR